MTGRPEPGETGGIHVSDRLSQHGDAENGSAGHLEGLPLDLSCGRDGLGLDEKRPRVDQLHALQSLTAGRVQVLSLSHLPHLGLTVAGQLQDRLRDGGGVRGRDLRRERTAKSNYRTPFLSKGFVLYCAGDRNVSCMKTAS